MDLPVMLKHIMWQVHGFSTLLWLPPSLSSPWAWASWGGTGWEEGGDSKVKAYWAWGSLCTGSGSRLIDLTEKEARKWLKKSPLVKGLRMCCVCPVRMLKVLSHSEAQRWWGGRHGSKIRDRLFTPVQGLGAGILLYWHLLYNVNDKCGAANSRGRRKKGLMQKVHNSERGVVVFCFVLFLNPHCRRRGFGFWSIAGGEWKSTMPRWTSISEQLEPLRAFQVCAALWHCRSSHTQTRQ